MSPKKTLLLFLSCFSFLTASEICCMGTEHMYISGKYTGPKGVGYDKGYGSIDVFLAPSFLGNGWLPFIDLRGHTFGSKRWAANAGLGLRYLSSSHVYGINAYYDYRRSALFHYNQVSGGLEALGKVWDFRINGYLPVGKKQSSLYNAEFDSFKGHCLVLKGRKEYAFKGANAEIGAHIDIIEKAPIFVAAGPYYLNGKKDTTWGGQLRTGVELFARHCRLEGICSYDHHFKWIGQGQIAINFTFGGAKPLPEKNCVSCCDLQRLERRAIQPVAKREIIPTSKGTFNEIAKHPNTGSAYGFVFVDNTSSSEGTFESPYPSLKTAEEMSLPNEAIYVFGGDGGTTGLDAGIILKDNQHLLGGQLSHSVPTTKGMITIPPHGSTPPTLMNPTGDIVTLSNNNIISGFNLTAHQNGIKGDGVANTVATRNTLTLLPGASNGIHLTDPTGTVQISDNTFGDLAKTHLLPPNGIKVDSNSPTTLDSLIASNNTFGKIDDAKAINFDVQWGSTVKSKRISGNSFGDVTNGANAILVNVEGKLENLITSNNTFPFISVGRAFGINLNIDPGGTVNNFTASNNKFGTDGVTNDAAGIFVSVGGVSEGGKLEKFIASRNNFPFISASAGITLSVDDKGTVNNFTASNNKFTTLSNSPGISAITSVDGGTIKNFVTSNNSFESIVDGSTGIIANALGGTFSNFTSSINTFKKVEGYNSSGINVYAPVTISNLQLESNTFSQIESGASGINLTFESGVNNNCTISQNIFLKISGAHSDTSSNGITFLFGTQDPQSKLSILGNTFIANTLPGSGPILKGFGVNVEVGPGELCLDFVDNTASPTNSPDPYIFSNSSGIFNIDKDSPNTGNINRSGTIHNPGTCSVSCTGSCP